MSEQALSAFSKKFLTALTSATSERAVSLQLSEFYDIENDLRRKFAAKESGLDPYANLIPVFHPTVYSMGAHYTKARVINENTLDEKYVCPLSEKNRREDGTESFIQGGFPGFKRNWDMFTEGALDNVNWYFP